MLDATLSNNVGGAVAAPRGLALAPVRPLAPEVLDRPLPRGLPNTPVDSLKSLWGAVFLFALRDLFDDKHRADALRWLASPSYTQVAVYAGLDILTAFRIRVAYFQGQLCPRQLSYALCGLNKEAA